VPSRAQTYEQASSEYDDIVIIVLFARSNAHLTGPFFVVLEFLYDVACADSSRDVTGMTNCIRSSSGGSKAATNIALVVAFCVYSATNISEVSK